MNRIIDCIINEGSRHYFDIGSTLCPYFEIGSQSGTDIWLEGLLVGPDEEYIFNGRLFIPGIAGTGTVIDNFPKSPAPQGWYIRKHVDEEGYDLVRQSSEEVLFGYKTIGFTCFVTTNLYSQNGILVAKTTPTSLDVGSIRLRLGRHGILFAA